MSGACGKVTISGRNDPCSNPASGKIHYGTPSLLFGCCVCETQCFGGGASASSEATTCNHQFSESE